MFLWIDSARRLLRRYELTQPAEEVGRQPRFEAELANLSFRQLDLDGPDSDGPALQGRRLGARNLSSLL